MTPRHPSPDPMVATSPEDLLAFVPVAIGFVPTTSAVMLTFGGRRPFHARVDLPDDPADADVVAETLLRPALLHEVASVVRVVYDDDTTVADEVGWSLVEAFTAGGIEVVELLRVHEGHWFAVLPGRPRSAYDGVAFDVGAHPFTARAVVDGRVTHASREALRATLDPDPAAVAAVEACGEVPPVPLERVHATVRRHVAARRPCPPAQLAALAAALADPAGRDEAWSRLEKEAAPAHVEFWCDAVRRLPADRVADAAAVLAFVAWLAGEGALAWCAVDRCRAVQPVHSLARLVADMLDAAVPPQAWEGLRRPADGAA